MDQASGEIETGAANDPTNEERVTPAPSIVPRPRKKNLGGIPIEIAGSVWYLPSLGFSAGWAPQRDSLYDESLLGNQVYSADVDECAFAMFLMNYDQTAGEILDLIGRADRKELVGIVTGNALNLDLMPEHRNFTYYARTALRAPASTPTRSRPRSAPESSPTSWGPAGRCRTRSSPRPASSSRFGTICSA